MSMAGEGRGDGEKVPSAIAAASMLLQEQQQVAGLVLFSRIKQRVRDTSSLS